jgi:hypothetical protein
MDEITKLMLHPSAVASGITTEFATLLLDDVGEALTNRGVDTSRCPALVRQIAVIRINQLGSEGVASEGYSGVSQSFMDDLPAEIRREINALRAVIW